MRAINEDDVKRLIRAEKRNWTLTQFPGVTEALNHVEGGLVGIRTVESQIPRWISVEERLPETETWVLCWYVDIDGDKWHTVGKLLKGGIWAVDIYEMDEPEYYTVTHWMPLPEPPKEDAK